MTKRTHVRKLDNDEMPLPRGVFYVHYLVASTWVPNPENKPFILHKNGDRSNNCASNLEWATLSEKLYHYRTVRHYGDFLFVDLNENSAHSRS